MKHRLAVIVATLFAQSVFSAGVEESFCRDAETSLVSEKIVSPAQSGLPNLVFKVEKVVQECEKLNPPETYFSSFLRVRAVTENKVRLAPEHTYTNFSLTLFKDGKEIDTWIPQLFLNTDSVELSDSETDVDSISFSENANNDDLRYHSFIMEIGDF